MISVKSILFAFFALMLDCYNGKSAHHTQKASARSMTTSEVAERVGRPGWKIVDIRDSNAFNGWIMNEEKRGGHIPGATNLSLLWIEKHKEAIVPLIESKGLKKNNIVLCGNSATQAEKMADFLHKTAKIPVSQMFVYSEGMSAWSRDQDLPMDSLPRYQNLVPPSWIYRKIQNNDSKDYQIVEVAWRKRKEYQSGHLPSAIYLDTDEIESKPLWNLVSAMKLEQTLLSLGITKNTQVIIYGRDSTAASRAAVTMMYAGVMDVRLLNGGYKAWVDADLPIDTSEYSRWPKKKFGTKIPAHPNWVINIKQAKEVLENPNGRLVSIRSWPEYIGETSGYLFIKPKGRIRGAVWGHAGTKKQPMQDFRNPDNTLRDYHEIAENWRVLNIKPDNQISFYCGTGWRASEAFFAAYLMGYKNISVYDGGWYEWSANKKNPVEKGKPNR